MIKMLPSPCENGRSVLHDARCCAVLVGGAVFAAVSISVCQATSIVIEPRFVHLRNDATREWDSFPEQPAGAHLEVRFPASRNAGEYSLRYRQQDVKQSWRVLLNGKPLGELIRDEADIVAYLPIAAELLITGENVLRIESPARGPQTADDIRVGELRVEPRSVTESLGEATLQIDVVDAETNRPLPARITIADVNGSLHATAASSSGHLATRPGVVYTSDGQAQFGVPAGQYTIFASRGFEYSLAKAETTLVAGQIAQRTLAIRREVPTPGYVACDTHVHTLTYSGHGDATINERMITLAGEGIELPIATEHNAHLDYEGHAQRLGVRQYFTPVVGNEVTTAVGHFNIFPVQPDARVPDYRQKQWGPIFDSIFATPTVKVAILNHARDVHSGVRPLGPEWFNAAIGENVAGWPMRFNALEIINSGATQTDPLRLPRDWMSLLNHGYLVTPVGSSDSHDVARYIVGQGRTYIRCDDRDVAHLDVGQAIDNFLAGRVSVSYGLLTEMTIDGKYRSGDLAVPTGNDVEINLRVLGSHWVNASRVQLYINGQLFRDEAVGTMPDHDTSAGLKWQANWKLQRPKHDVTVVAIALGKGVDGPYWATAKPYQPASPRWEPYVLGVSGAIWLDGDNDGRRSTARDYAERAYTAEGRDLSRLIAALQPYDVAVASQAADFYRASGRLMSGPEFAETIKTAPPAVAAGFRAYAEAWRDNELAQSRP